MIKINTYQLEEKRAHCFKSVTKQYHNNLYESIATFNNK